MPPAIAFRASMHFSRARASDTPEGAVLAEIHGLPAPVQPVVQPKRHCAFRRHMDVHPIAIRDFVNLFLRFQGLQGDIREHAAPLSKTTVKRFLEALSQKSLLFPAR